MQKLRNLFTIASLAGIASVAGLSACSNDGSTVFTANNGPVAYIRFVNAIPDSGAQDWRFVDQVEGSPNALNLPFRGVFPGATYQQVSAGNRHLRVFQAAFDQGFTDPTQDSPAIVSTVFIDSTIAFTAGQHYSIIAQGSLKAKTAKFLIIPDNFTDPGNSVSIRVVNTGAGTIDTYASATGGSAALPTAFATGIANGAASPWVTMATGAVAFRANASGTTTVPTMVDVTAPAGVAANKDLDQTAIGGTTIAGSVLTAFVFPAAVQGTRGALVLAGTCPTKCTTAGAVFAVDKFPPSGF